MNRLKKLRNDMNLSREKLGDILDISPESILDYENEEVEISSSILKRLSNFYNVTVDYILGLTNIKTYFIENEEIGLPNKDNCFDEFKLLSLILNKLKENHFRIHKIQLDINELKKSLNVNDKDKLSASILKFLKKLSESYKATVYTDKTSYARFNILTGYVFNEYENTFELEMGNLFCEYFEKFYSSMDITVSVDNSFNAEISDIYFHFKLEE
ncbi:helix-turn-helix family protein [Clostridioides difficile CD160]|nr:helix-turn-helix family protein [Clostridioides difficile CD160]